MAKDESLQAISSVELIALCTSNNSDAWDEFIKRFHRYISVCVFRESRNYKLDPSELTQEDFLKLLANDCKILKDFHGETENSVFAYLATIVYSTVKDQIRREIAQKRSAIVLSLDKPIDFQQGISLKDILPAGTETSPDLMFQERIIPKKLKELLKSALSGANATRDTIIFHLHIINGLSPREIGEMPNVALNTNNVQTIITRTKERLKEVLGKKGAVEL
ncbi:MAG: RNA polymerase sigma factor [Blastocatellia bacterium]|nr:RNA polymerase sigma factor [Blastocatellia bacterium]